MSTTVLCYGVMVKLSNLVEPTKREELNDLLSNSGVEINYEGSLAYIDLNATKSYPEKEDLFKVLLFGGPNRDALLTGYSVLCRYLHEHGLKFDLMSPRWFSCIWHTGSDSPLNEMTAANFSDPKFGC